MYLFFSFASNKLLLTFDSRIIYQKVWFLYIYKYYIIYKLIYIKIYICLVLLRSCCSVVKSHLTCVTQWIVAHQASLTFTISQSLLKLMSIESVMPSNHLVLCCSLLLPSIFSSIRVFSNESDLQIRWPKYCSFNLNISPSNEYLGLISFRIFFKILDRPFIM